MSLLLFAGTDRGNLAYFRACSCKKNHHRIDRFGPCFSCPAYGSCKNEILNFTDGYYVDWNVINSSVSRYFKFIENIKTLGRIYDEKYSNMTGLFPQANRCLNLKACKIYNFTTRCVKGHQGFLCSDCIKGYYKDDETCIVCPEKKRTVINISITVFLLVILLLMVICLVLMTSNKDQLNMLLSRTKICINYFYFSSKMYDIMTFIDWPTEMLKLISFLKWLELNPLVLLSVTCWLTKFTLYDSYMFFLSINGFILMASITGIFFLRLCVWFGTLEREQMKKCRKSLVAVTSISIFFLYTPTSISIVQLLPVACKAYYLSFPGKVEVFYFMQEPSMKCFTSSHNKLLIPVYVSLIYVFGIPLGIPVVIWYLRRKFSKEARIHFAIEEESTQEIQQVESDHIPDVEDKFRENLSIAEDIYNGLEFFYGNYKEQYFFWESLEMIKKMFLASIAVFIGERSYTSFALLIMFSGVFSVVHAHFKPIASTKEHFLQLLCLTALHSHLLLGLSMKMESEWIVSDTQQDIEALSVSLMICNITVAALLFGE